VSDNFLKDIDRLSWWIAGLLIIGPVICFIFLLILDAVAFKPMLDVDFFYMKEWISRSLFIAIIFLFLSLAAKRGNDWIRLVEINFLFYLIIQLLLLPVYIIEDTFSSIGILIPFLPFILVPLYMIFKKMRISHEIMAVQKIDALLSEKRVRRGLVVCLSLITLFYFVLPMIYIALDPQGDAYRDMHYQYGIMNESFIVMTVRLLLFSLPGLLVLILALLKKRWGYILSPIVIVYYFLSFISSRELVSLIALITIWLLFLLSKELTIETVFTESEREWLLACRDRIKETFEMGKDNR
jgi:hypothetical protein